MYNNRHKYTLESGLGQMVLDRDPMGWDNTETEIGRSEKTYGIFLTVSNNLQFTGKAKQFLEDNYAYYGVNAEVRLTKQIKHPKTDEWELAFTGFLDFTTRKIENNKLQIDFVEGGLREILTSQMREKFELNRETDIKGNSISPLNPKTLSLKGREIYLVSKLESNKDTFELSSGRWDSGGSDRYAYIPPPMEVTANSDTQNVKMPFESINSKGGNSQGGAETKYYLIADRNRGRTERDFKLSFKLNKIVDDDVDMLSAPTFRVIIRKYTGGDTYTYSEADDIVLLDVNPYDVIGQSWDLSYADVIEPKKDESYALLFESRAAYGGQFGDTGFMNLYFTEYSGYIDLREDSFFKRTTANMLRAFDVGSRLTEIFTGKPSFKSSVLDTGFWKDLGMSCGFWLRNMKKNTEEGTQERTMTISFEDFYKSIHAIEPVGYGIITEGNKQYIALEKLRYFFQPYTTIKLGQVSKIKRQTAPEFIYNSITTGYMKGGNYEKPLGLDEYNVQTNYITPVTKVETRYNVLGESRADSYAAEQARRMQYEDYPDEDTPYDKDNFLFDCKSIGSVYEPRLYGEDFQAPPVGVYSPETAYNLRLTPTYNLLRHSYWLNSATVKYPTNKMRYTSSEGNSELRTQLIGGNPVKENDDILISDLANPIFEPEWVEFELPFTQEVMDQLTGQTKIGEESIDNYYGLMEYINEAGQKEKAYLFTAKISKKITFKALKAYGI